MLNYNINLKSKPVSNSVYAYNASLLAVLIEVLCFNTSINACSHLTSKNCKKKCLYIHCKDLLQVLISIAALTLHGNASTKM